MAEYINPEEKLFRKVLNHPNYWKKDTNRPSSAAFKDSKGVSVDRDGQRDKVTIIETMKENLGEDNMKAIIYVEASHCLNLEASVVADPVEGNEFHALIVDSSIKLDLTKSKARRLAENSSIVFLDGEIV